MSSPHMLDRTAHHGPNFSSDTMPSSPAALNVSICHDLAGGHLDDTG